MFMDGTLGFTKTAPVASCGNYSCLQAGTPETSEKPDMVQGSFRFTWAPKVCRIMAFYRFGAIILLTFGGLGNSFYRASLTAQGYVLNPETETRALEPKV